MGVTNEQILSAVLTGMADLKEEIKAVNGRLRQSETDVAVLGQWKVNHNKGHEALESDVKTLRKQQNWYSGLLALIQLIFAAVLGLKDGP